MSEMPEQTKERKAAKGYCMKNGALLWRCCQLNKRDIPQSFVYRTLYFNDD